MKRRTKRKAAKRRTRRRISGDQSFAPAVIGRMKRGKKTRSRRRSKVGALKGETGTLVGVAAGVVLGILVDKLGDKFLPNVSPKIKSLVKVAGGVALVMSKKANLKAAGLGLAANGITTASKEFGLINGIDQFMSGIGAGSDTMTIEMNGTPENAGNLMSGTDEPAFMSGSSMSMPSVIGG